MTVEVAVVGGGPAGAAVATHLARAGHEVLLLERAAAYRWRAGGVFTSPAAVTALRRLGLPEDRLAAVARSVPAMRVETSSGITFRLTYGDDGSLTASAVGLDRAVLDPVLLDLAAQAGAEVRAGVTVTTVEPPAAPGGPFQLALSDHLAGDSTASARVVVGADGIRSQVARSLGVARGPHLGSRVGLTFHLADPATDFPRDARMRILHDGYVGIAPVPRGRVNVGIVLGKSWRSALKAEGAERLATRIVQGVPPTEDDPGAWRTGVRCDEVVGAAPIGHRVVRSAGPGWLLVGDAAGFLDPFTGEGLHRALVSAELAAEAITGILAGRGAAPESYRAAMRAQFGAKDLVSWLVQGFLGRPVLFDYAARRLARRAGPRETMGLVMGDLVPAKRALEPRFLAALLAP